MARKKIREYDGKRLFWAHLNRHWNGKAAAPPDLTHPFVNRSLGVNKATNFRELKLQHPWVTTTRLVVKPDILIGQRGKHDLVKLNCTVAEAEAFVDERLQRQLTLPSGASGPVSHFLLEPFVPHTSEYYVAITPARLHNLVQFTAYGGIHVEEHWDKMLQVEVPVMTDIADVDLSAFRAQIVECGGLHNTGVDVERILEFVRALYRMFMELDFAMIEINPFVLSPHADVDDDGSSSSASGRQAEIIPLDFVAELDDTAFFKNRNKWLDGIEFPHPFGASMTTEEEFVHSLDAKTGASLKLTILKPTGRIWNLVAGGGASVIFADTVCDMGYAHELANYGEYSGAPNEEETYQYARTVIDLATRRPDGLSRALLIGGGIANFTDVAKTFKGIIHALKEFAEQLKKANVKIFVRRAGPNFELGLKLMRQLGADINVPIEVYGPETQMTYIVARALATLEEDGSISKDGHASASTSAHIPAKRLRDD